MRLWIDFAALVNLFFKGYNIQKRLHSETKKNDKIFLENLLIKSGDRCRSAGVLNW